jgi:hypothetical protein
MSFGEAMDRLHNDRGVSRDELPAIKRGILNLATERPAILNIAKGDLIEVTRGTCGDGSGLYRVTSAAESEDGLSVTIQTEPWTGDAAASPYRSEVVQDEPARCWFGP